MGYLYFFGLVNNQSQYRAKGEALTKGVNLPSNSGNNKFGNRTDVALNHHISANHLARHKFANLIVF